MIATQLEYLANQPETFSAFQHIPRWRTEGAPGRDGKMFIEISIPEDMDMRIATETIRRALYDAGVKGI